MKTLTLTLAGNTFFNPDIIVDNVRLNPIKTKRGVKTYLIETEKEEVDIEINKWYELNSKYWLPIFLFFFVISFFGLFDIKQKKFYNTIKYKGKITLSKEEQSYLKLTFGTFKRELKAFVSEGNCAIEDNETNLYIRDEEASKRAELLRKIKKYTWIGIAVVLVIIFILKLVL